MNSFLTAEDLKLLHKGLDLYEGDPVRAAMFSSMIGIVLGDKKRSEEDAEADLKRVQDKADAECAARKLAVARLRVKLLEMAERPSEFAS